MVTREVLDAKLSVVVFGRQPTYAELHVRGVDSKVSSPTPAAGETRQRVLLLSAPAQIPLRIDRAGDTPESGVCSKRAHQRDVTWYRISQANRTVALMNSDVVLRNADLFDASAFESLPPLAVVLSLTAPTGAFREACPHDVLDRCRRWGRVSYDGFVFKTPLPEGMNYFVLEEMPPVPVYMNERGAENRATQFLASSGFEMVNPCLRHIAEHWHCANETLHKQFARVDLADARNRSRVEELGGGVERINRAHLTRGFRCRRKPKRPSDDDDTAVPLDSLHPPDETLSEEEEDVVVVETPPKLPPAYDAKGRATNRAYLAAPGAKEYVAHRPHKKVETPLHHHHHHHPRES